MTKMTDQEVFNKVWDHMIKQGKQSVDEHDPDSCLYRGPNGLMCAAGVLIPDEFVQENLMASKIPYVRDNYNIDLVQALQDCHDQYSYLYNLSFTEFFKGRAKEVAKRFGLEVPC